MQKQIGDAEVKMVNVSSLGRIFNFTLFKGLFIGSFDENLLIEIIDHIGSGIPVHSDKSFRRVMITSGENVDANIYVNHHNLKMDLRYRFRQGIIY
ncbi:MAG: hypothetical protein R2764_09785 [Bacteroidales bacterium]